MGEGGDKASTSCLVRMPLRSSSSTKAEVSHMLEMARSSRVTRPFGSSFIAARSHDE